MRKELENDQTEQQPPDPRQFEFIEVDGDALRQHWRIKLLERRFQEVDRVMFETQLRLEGVIIGLAIAAAIQIISNIW